MHRSQIRFLRFLPAWAHESFPEFCSSHFRSFMGTEWQLTPWKCELNASHTSSSAQLLPEAWCDPDKLLNQTRSHEGKEQRCFLQFSVFIAQCKKWIESKLILLNCKIQLFFLNVICNKNNKYNKIYRYYTFFWYRIFGVFCHLKVLFFFLLASYNKWQIWVQ